MVNSVTTPDSSTWTKIQQKLAAADTNGDGVVSPQELAGALSGNSDTVNALIDDADTDGDGALSVSEFVTFSDRFSAATGLTLLSAQETDSALAKAFATLDSDNSGKISAKELSSASSLVSDDIKQQIDLVDRTGDGTFNQDDIARMLMQADGSIKSDTQTSDGSGGDDVLNAIYQASVARIKAVETALDAKTAAAASASASTTDSGSTTGA
ncbi:EF-hand domain-containing protein [Phaeospirillum tilakii]|uniref:EF-hand domain-containing protein n=1 Tax=Phaeospirillum tilakii TaxID=741673 RepID=A0ABW5CGR0_9PROT